MRTLRFGAVLVATVVMTSIHGVSAAPYKSPNGYTITPPKGWTTVKDLAGTEVMFIAPTRANINMVVQHNVPDDIPLDLVREESINLERQMFTKFKVLSQGTWELGGQRAVTLTSNYFLNQPAEKMRLLQVFTVYKNRLFVITCTARDKDFPKYLSTFKQTMQTLKWTNAIPAIVPKPKPKATPKSAPQQTATPASATPTPTPIETAPPETTSTPQM